MISEITHIHPTAKVPHPCDHCHEPIYAGMRHVKFVYRDGRTIHSERYHLRCEQAVELRKRKSYPVPAIPFSLPWLGLL